LTRTTLDRPNQQLVANGASEELEVDSFIGTFDRDQATPVEGFPSDSLPQTTVVKVVPWIESEIDRWVWAAMKRTATVEREDGTYTVEVPEAPGAWFNEKTLDGALAGLPAVLYDWAAWKVEDQDDDLPVFDGIDLNPR
jgi:predicted RNase H-like HicB family nuclease